MKAACLIKFKQYWQRTFCTFRKIRESFWFPYFNQSLKFLQRVFDIFNILRYHGPYLLPQDSDRLDAMMVKRKPSVKLYTQQFFFFSDFNFKFINICRGCIVTFNQKMVFVRIAFMWLFPNHRNRLLLLSSSFFMTGSKSLLLA